MRCIVTAGPTFETMDNVRRLTNFSTGRLGTELANHLSAKGHEVTLLIGEQATFAGKSRATTTERFTTTQNLRERLKKLGGKKVDAVFHAAAVSDFCFGKIWLRSASGKLTEIKSGKISTHSGTLLAEFLPTPKIISQLRGFFPNARLIGWKFEVDGNRAGVIAKAARQIADSRTDACVANGAAYGLGFGFVTGRSDCVHLRNMKQLFAALERFISQR